MSDDIRGSLKLIQSRWNKSIGEKELESLMEAVSFRGVKFNDILCHGMPPHVDRITGTLTAQREVLDKLTNVLVSSETLRLREFRVFPRGIPNIEDLLVHFELGHNG